MSKSLQKFETDTKTATFPFLVLAVSILLTIGISYIFYQSSKTKDLTRFNNEVSRQQLSIENKINLYIALLKGGRGFVESTPAITRLTFAEYVKSLDLPKNYTGVQGIGYTKVIAANEQKNLAEKMKSEGLSDFQIFPASDKEFYQAILYLEPQSEQNRKMLGFDLSSEQNRRETLELARDTGEAVSSPKVSAINETEATAKTGFIICLPIYKGGKLPDSIEERRKNINGFIYSPFQVNDFLAAAQEDRISPGIMLKIYDGEAKPENLLAQSLNQEIRTFADQIEEEYIAEREINVAGRKWLIRYNSLPTFAAQSSLGWSPLIFTIGIIFSLLFFGLTYWEASTRIKLQKVAANLFELEQQKQGLLEKEQAARLSAEQANKTKDEFIEVVSHELRTPLNAIAGWSRILKTDDLSPKTKNLALEKIDKNLRAQAKLVEDLLEYSQLVSGTIALEFKELNLSEIFEESVSVIEPLAREKNINITKENSLNGQHFAGDSQKIKIVLESLLANAVKFTHAGGNIITTVEEKDEKLQMTVSDNGRGIETDFLPHIFDRFTQADSSSTRTSGGLGLGLTISNQIVKLHNGEIAVESAGLGKGATFKLTLPKITKVS